MARACGNLRTSRGRFSPFWGDEGGTLLRGSLVILAMLGACSDDSSQYYDFLSEECDTCLSLGGDEGCEALWHACDEVPGCDDYVLCQVRARCYAESPDSGCEEHVGCEFAGDATDEAKAAAAAFETCARTECQDACGYVAP